MNAPWTSLKLIQWTAEYFEKKGIPNSRLDAELLLAHVLGCQRIDLYVHHERTVTEKHLPTYHTLIERRAKREPLQYIIGETEFWGLKLKVTPEVLIPRPETELLVELALKTVGARSSRPGRENPAPTEILDMGTGSGCIAIALAKHMPNAKVIATDISKEALAIAHENAEGNSVADRIEFLLSDIAPWKSFHAAGKTFDLIVSNPPYIPTSELESLQPEVAQFEPRSALDGGPDGLEVIQKILEEAPPFLKPDGFLLLEIGEDQGAWLRERTFPGLSLKDIQKDYQNIPRIAFYKKA